MLAACLSLDQSVVRSPERWPVYIFHAPLSAKIPLLGYIRGVGFPYRFSNEAEAGATGVRFGGRERPDLEFRRLTKRYGTVEAVSSIDLAVPQGAFLAMLGPSGCGKTTCLRMIGGFEQPTEGEVRIAGEVVNGIPAYQRPINMVFQHYALFPHMNVAQKRGLRPAPAAPPPARRRNRPPRGRSAGDGAAGQFRDPPDA